MSIVVATRGMHTNTWWQLSHRWTGCLKVQNRAIWEKSQTGAIEARKGPWSLWSTATLVCLQCSPPPLPQWGFPNHRYIQCNASYRPRLAQPVAIQRSNCEELREREGMQGEGKWRGGENEEIAESIYDICDHCSGNLNILSILRKYFGIKTDRTPTNMNE